MSGRTRSHQCWQNNSDALTAVVSRLRRQIVQLQSCVDTIPCETYHVIHAVSSQSQRLADAHVTTTHEVHHRHVTADLTPSATKYTLCR